LWNFARDGCVGAPQGFPKKINIFAFEENGNQSAVVTISCHVWTLENLQSNELFWNDLQRSRLPLRIKMHFEGETPPSI
jgi:hypothetical protein